MEIIIRVKDINALTPEEVAVIAERLSWPDSGSDSSLRKELDKRYLNPQPGPHPEMALALVWLDKTLVGWVGTRLWPEKFKGDPILAQTIECFVAPQHRRRGLASIGLHALISASRIDRTKPVAVYETNVVKLAEQCGCKIVLLCEA